MNEHLGSHLEGPFGRFQCVVECACTLLRDRQQRGATAENQPHPDIGQLADAAPNQFNTIRRAVELRPRMAEITSQKRGHLRDLMLFGKFERTRC